MLFSFKKEIKILVNLYNPPISFKSWLSRFQNFQSYTHLPYPCLKHIMYILDCLNIFLWMTKQRRSETSFLVNAVSEFLYHAIKSTFSGSPMTSNYQVQWFTDSSCILTSLLHLTLLLSGCSLDPCLLCHTYDPSSSHTHLMAPQIPLRPSVSLCPLSPGMQPLEKDF